MWGGGVSSVVEDILFLKTSLGSILGISSKTRKILPETLQSR